MTFAIIMAASAFAAVDVPAPEGALPVRISGPWTLVLGPGRLDTLEGAREVKEAVSIAIAPMERQPIRGEEHKPLPVFDPKAGAWRRGSKLKRLIAEECTGTGLAVPSSIRLSAQPDGTGVFVEGTDYVVDAFWGQIGRIDGGGIDPEQAVYVDYDYYPTRVDSILLDASGTLRVVQGPEGVGNIRLAEPGSAEIAVCTVWHNGIMEGLEPENVFPIEFSAPGASLPPPSAERLLPKTLARLRNGEPVTIVAWGDSVTNGGGLQPGQEALRFQQQFLTRLQKRFPKSALTLHTAAWPGYNSISYMNAPAGGPYDFQRDVLDRKPDLVIIEFVNDASLHGEALNAQYAKIRDALWGISAEIILITPHYVRQDWMDVTTVKVDDDPRPYVRGLREFANHNGIAVADAARLWGALWRKGIPYPIILANAINHPDERGMALFADALMAVFPEE
ncbi:MAG: SGNH/GDSL hydrolase family protein [Candidatus Hydrogenedentales bacterium]|jgi:lysophospholipase L1-like esterase